MDLAYSWKEFLAAHFVVIYQGIENGYVDNIGSGKVNGGVVCSCGDRTKRFRLTPFGRKVLYSSSFFNYYFFTFYFFFISRFIFYFFLSPIFVGIKLVEFLVIKIIANYTESDASWIDIHTQQLSRRSCVRPRSWYIWHFCVCFVHIQSARIQTK